MKRSKAVSLLLVAVLAIGLLGGCDRLKGLFGGKAGGPAGPAPEVKVQAVEPQRVVFTTEIAGRTSPYRIAEVRPQVSGIIKARNFTEGADVKAGSTLYQIDPATYKAQLASAAAALARAEANVAPLRLRRDRYRELNSISAVSRQEYDDAEAALKQAIAEVGVQKAAVENAAIRLNYTKVNAPISGRAGLSAVTAGALVTENQPTPLTTIQQLDPMYVDVTQSSTEMLRLRRALESGILKADSGQAVVRLRLEDGTPYAHEGRLQFADVTVDPSTGMVTIRALFPNPRRELLPNMYVRAEVVEGVDEKAILAPQRSVIRDAKGDAFVYLVNGEGKVEKRDVRTVRTVGDCWVVSSGLEAGDILVTEGLQRIRPGMAVRIAGEAQAAGGQAGGAAAR